MSDDAEHTADATLRQTWQQRVRTLIERHGWTLLTEDELVDHVFGANPSLEDVAGLDQRIKNHYIIALYEACRQDTNVDRREQGYQELFRYLYRAAYNRWPDLAQDVTQEALLIVYEQIDRCREPAAFLAFALFKLRAAFQQFLRSQRNDVSLEKTARRPAGEELATLDAVVVERECSTVLLEAIKQLPDKQQQTVFLKFFHGWGDGLIGQQLGVTAGNVRIMRHRALEQLRNNADVRAYFEQASRAD